MIDYTYQYKRAVDLEALRNGGWDVFISAYNPSERVCLIFNVVEARQKDWILHREYDLGAAIVPGIPFESTSRREDEFILEYAEARLGGQDLSTLALCVDVTGFMRPHMLFLVRYLAERGVRKFDVLYTEPSHYKRRDDTKFANERVHTVRQVAGFEGLSRNDNTRDLLVIGAGYEDKLIAEVAEDKDRARKLVLLGLPSLKADMYQQGVLRTRLARDALGEGVRELFAPAGDPFATATVLSKLISREREMTGYTNLYLSPLSTKPSALGFGLFYLRECQNDAASIIFPFSDSYFAGSSSGIGRIWQYTVEL